MALADFQALDDREKFLTDPSVATSLLRNADDFVIAAMGDYLDILQTRTGEDFGALRRLVENSLMFQDQQPHLVMRRLFAPFFANKAIDQWQGCVDEAVAIGLEHLAQASDPDLIGDFVRPALMSFMTRFIGCAPDATDQLYDSMRRVNSVVSHPLLSLSELRRINAACEYILEKVEQDEPAGDQHPPSFKRFLKENSGPGSSIEIQHAQAAFVLVSGITMAQSLGLALYGLLRRPKETWQQVAQPGWVDDNLDQLFSSYPSALTMVRVPTRDTEIGGCPFHKGVPAVVDVASCNNALRDSRGEHARLGLLSFGAGAHKCPGEALSRMVFKSALTALARRFPNLCLHVDRAQFQVSPMMHALLALPCERDGQSVQVTARLVDIKSLEAARNVVNRDADFMPPAMETHLKALGERVDLDLDPAITIARNAMFFMSGERHAVLRRVVAGHLGNNRLDRWQPRIETAIDAGLAQLAQAQVPDLIRDFADPVFHGSTQDMLGIAPRDSARFNELAPVLQDVLEPWLPLRELRRLQGVFTELLDTMEIPEGAANPSLLQVMAEQEMPDFTLRDKKALVLVLYGASFNLAHTLGNMAHWVLTQSSDGSGDPADPVWIDQNFEQLMSICASPKYIYRMARNAGTVDGVPVAKNDTLRLQLLSINRGTAVGNLAFGHGLHRCVGAALSRRVLKSALPRLFQRFPDITLLPQQQRYFAMSQTVAMSALPCRISRTAQNQENT
ncbi:cytochrome P450 [Rhodobacter sp. NTK016B]|uniref:cytochrome P450 n=1 Tax=Rhodobacter sp. NTK016B TaxID=2759676 RepID=UPI001A8FBA8E|nr:cytochrome P450 [Rhodobacter sp. NTK016B]MBN8294609.1 cytochrome P450 [Rhodobacter sp. NTK016B]